jgi:hypothetical protein
MDAKAELGVGDDFDPYRYRDPDMIVVYPNMDPHPTGTEVRDDQLNSAGDGLNLGLPAFLDRVNASSP